MAKYRKLPIEVEAWMWRGEKPSDRPQWLNEKKAYLTTDSMLVIPTLEGEMLAEIGDYIIRGVHGEIYPCKPDIFAKTYEAL